jgi:DNA-binding SARP family transcriptional activator
VSESRSLLRSFRSSQPATGGSETRVRLGLLSGFELVRDGVLVPVPRSAQRVVAYIALHERPLVRAEVAGSLWLDSADDRAGANLRSALWRIHRAEPGLIEASGRQLRLGGSVRLDLHEAESVARAALGGEGNAVFELDLAALTADLLPGWYDDWVLVERERFRQLRLRALDAVCDQLARAGRIGDALQAGLLSVAGEPLRESAHRALVRAHLADGNVVEAVREYELYRGLLREHLGIEPSERMKELIRGLDDQETDR